MIKFEDLKNIRNFSELTIDEYATASVDDISQMFLNLYQQNAAIRIKIKGNLFNYLLRLQQPPMMNSLSTICMHRLKIEMLGLVKNV